MNLSLFSAGDVLICTVPYPDLQLAFLMREGGAVCVNMRHAGKDYPLFFRLSQHDEQIVVGQLSSPADNKMLLELLSVLTLDQVKYRLIDRAKKGTLFSNTNLPSNNGAQI